MKIKRGELNVVGNKIYGICESCGKVVCISKFLSGSLHLCRTEQEIEKHGKWGD